jgi:5-methylcytosine-specific restriction endonuclease McrA
MMENIAVYKANTNIIKAVFDKGDGRCWYCGRLLTIESRTSAGGIMRNAPAEYFTSTYVIDHFYPRKLGGTDDIENLVPACWSCNGMKRAYTVEEWRVILTRIENGAPKFTDEQLYYLEKIGVRLPVYEPHVFYFETAEFTGAR